MGRRWAVMRRAEDAAEQTEELCLSRVCVMQLLMTLSLKAVEADRELQPTPLCATEGYSLKNDKSQHGSFKSISPDSFLPPESLLSPPFSVLGLNVLHHHQAICQRLSRLRLRRCLVSTTCRD
ncbi:hypothetical protein Baya_0047 [Bagarius yarrelli]|uniref:Uncharacterized protein n=1 Tax=Bagarius yarrelli TaxID=175774 RepID=A0A556TH57_BAGYA|nr:hypothetical protein Baya_0047 [Bagarius yarrelli]